MLLSKRVLLWLCAIESGRALISPASFGGRIDLTAARATRMAKGYYPPDITVLDDDDGDDQRKDKPSTPRSKRNVTPPPDITVLGDNKSDANTRRSAQPKEQGEKRRSISTSSGVRGVSWMKRNDDFLANVGAAPPPIPQPLSRPMGERGGPRRFDRGASRDGRRSEGEGEPPRRPFRDFTGSRVFVQGIPPSASWQDLKDHFRVAGTVVFASVSLDQNTGESKGHGIVQFETTEMALTAIAIMRDHPMDGNTLYVREDVKPDENADGRPNIRKTKKPSDDQSWKCADEENAGYLSDSDQTEVKALIRARNDARFRRNYKASDSIREELKIKFGVHVDDRLKMWWTSMDGETVPQIIHDIKGEGRWNFGGQKEWSQIPTTLENDACVDPNLVQGLLRQRDIARREKDFATADALLEQARTAPDGDLELRIHDESRTWRIWTAAPPPRPVAPHMSPADRCVAIVQEHAPDKVDEIRTILESFPGREYKVLKKLKQKYLNEE